MEIKGDGYMDGFFSRDEEVLKLQKSNERLREVINYALEDGGSSPAQTICSRLREALGPNGVSGDKCNL